MAYLITLAVFAITLVHQPLQSGGWYWDTGNAFGFLGFAGLLYLFLDGGYSRRHHIHKLLSFAFATCLGLHLFWLWINDPTIWHYASLEAPRYMLLGLFSIVLVLVIILLALPATRKFWHGKHALFRRWHYALSLAAVASAYWHIIGSGFYVSTLEAWLLLGLVVTVVVYHKLQRLQITPTSHTRLLTLPIIAVLFVGLKLLGIQYLTTLAVPL